MERAAEVLPPSPEMSYASGIYEAAANADAVLILTDWKEFAKIDLARLNQVVRFPIVIDGRNLYRPQEISTTASPTSHGPLCLPGATRHEQEAGCVLGFAGRTCWTSRD